MTVFYIHGNRIDASEASGRGLRVYRQLVSRSTDSTAVRFVVFSWPAAQIRGPIRDVRLKAQRADFAGLQLAWILQRIPAESPTSLLGFSYGARVAGGALHLMGGGRICGHRVGEGEASPRGALRAVYWAAALDDDWLLPGRAHGRALSQIDALLLINNSCDRAMKFYHVSRKGSRPRALGRFGVAGLPRLGAAAGRIEQLDVCCAVGSQHDLERYLAARTAVERTWDYLLFRPVRLAAGDSERAANRF